MTHTRTHTYVEFANPYLLCEQCQRPTRRWHNNSACGCDDTWWNDPCGHTAGLLDTCPSWSPVDGCRCTGRNPHQVPPSFP